MRFAFTTILMAPRFGWQPAPDKPVRLELYDQVRDMGFDGVEFVLELHDDGMLDTPELCLRMVRAVDGVNVRVNPDLGNLVRHPESRDQWRAALEQLAPYTGYWHVKNYRNGQPAPIWDGDIDYAEAFATVQARGYNGWVSVEGYVGDDWLFWPYKEAAQTKSGFAHE